MSLDTFVRFCEPVYIRHTDIAEWWNSLSSMVYCLTGIMLLYQHHRYNRHFPRYFDAITTWVYRAFSCLWIALAFGSASFHAHQTLLSEFWDEGSMLFVTSFTSVCLVNLHPLTTGRRGIWFYGFYSLFVIVSTFMYVWIQNHTFFVLIFAISVVITLLLIFTQPAQQDMADLCEKYSPTDLSSQVSLTGHWTPRQDVTLTTFLGLIATLLWIVDQQCVAHSWKPRNLYFYEFDWYYWCHPLWHILTGVGAIFACEALLKSRINHVYRPLSSDYSPNDKDF